MPTYGLLVISSKIVSAILHLQRGDICTAENKVWLLFRDVNFGISSSKSVTGDILRRPTIVLFCFFCFYLYLQKPIPNLQKKRFYLSQQTFCLCVSDSIGTASASLGTLLAPAEPFADEYLQIPFCRAALFFSLNVTIHVENKCFE